MIDLLTLLDGLSRPRILIVGDLILDRYSWGSVSRICPEAPVGVLHTQQNEVRLGGAASVAALLRGLDAEVRLVGVVGDDADGRSLLRMLQESGIQEEAVFNAVDRPTTVKERFLGQTGNGPFQQLLRVDREATPWLTPDLEREMLPAIAQQLDECQALLIADYAKGVCTPALLDALLPWARDLGVPVLVDPARGGNYRRYRDANLLTPNRAEAELAAGICIRTPQDAFRAGQARLVRTTTREGPGSNA